MTAPSACGRRAADAAPVTIRPSATWTHDNALREALTPTSDEPQET